MLPFTVNLVAALAAVTFLRPSIAHPTTEYKRAANVIRDCVEPNAVALTFDDGPYIYMEDICNTLEAAGAVGTFFVNGNNWVCIYDDDAANRVKYAYAHGHQLASHTWRHANLTQLGWDDMHSEFWRVEDALLKIIGVMPAFVRPPYGLYNDLVREVAGLRGQTIILWDFDSGDTVGLPVDQQIQQYGQVSQSRPVNLLPINHETSETTAHEVIPYALNVLKSAGYKFVTLAECLGMPAYQFVIPPAQRDASWTCS
ncbi:carbohydrate esterase family 4 protein [Pluteus cervinus]|uniref:Carbohydrate esterase family 4 protein n=1 Tax=Pluteus cervinus TaxID=181527 RepID=A0ACD3B0A1_9AGAR|nr:carbohydrate esterase family 4 protein [Pluteus cervinus]